MNETKLQASAEAILFASGEPIEADKICEAMQIKESKLTQIIDALNEKYEKSNSSLEIIKLKDCYQICTKSEYAPIIRTALQIKKNSPLSQAAMEVLAVIAYNQPVTKSYIEQVRGVDCSGVVSSLISKDLICENGRLDLPGRPILYITTPNFLRCFDLESLDELPPLPEKETQAETDENMASKEDESSESETETKAENTNENPNGNPVENTGFDTNDENDDGVPVENTEE